MMGSPPLIEDETARLDSVRSLRLLDTPPEEAFDEMVELAAWTCRVPMAALSLIDENRQWFKAMSGAEIDQTSRDDAFCAHTIAEPTTLIVPDTHLDERFRDNPFVLGDPGVRFYAGVPIMIDEGLHVGTLCVFDTRPRSLFADERRALEILARRAAAQLRTIRMEWDTRDHLTGAVTHLAAARWISTQDTSTRRGVIHLDIDDLSGINARLGHAVGDWVLGVTGARLRDAVGDDAIVVRVRDDDFLVLIDELGAEDLDEEAERLRRAVEEPIGDLRLTVTVGAATAEPGDDGADLVEQAAEGADPEGERAGGGGAAPIR
mgnify:CR=1 FL=1